MECKPKGCDNFAAGGWLPQQLSVSHTGGEGHMHATDFGHRPGYGLAVTSDRLAGG